MLKYIITFKCQTVVGEHIFLKFDGTSKNQSEQEEERVDPILGEDLDKLYAFEEYTL